MVSTVGPSTVSTDGAVASTRYCFQRKSLYAAGRHWTFFYDAVAGTFSHDSSVDGVTWNAPGIIRAANSGSEFSVALETFIEPEHDHHYLHYVYSDAIIPGMPIYYRRGLLNANGSITWSAAEQIAEPGFPGYTYMRPTICVDIFGRPWIGYALNDSIEGSDLPFVTMSTTAPIWTTGAGFPNPMSMNPDPFWVCIVVPFGNDIHVTYECPFSPIFYDMWDNGINSWYGEIISLSNMGGDSFVISVTSHGEVNGGFEMPGGLPPTAHIAFQDQFDDLQHIAFDMFNGPSIEHLIYAGGSPLAPAISIRTHGSPVSGEENPDIPRTLFVFWTPITPEPFAHFVTYMKSTDAGITWTDWLGTPLIQELWIDETTLGFPGVNIDSAYFEEGHNDFGNGYIGLLYLNEGLSPDFVRYGALGFIDPDEDLQAEFQIGLANAAEDLLGEFELTHWEDLLGEFLIGLGNAAEELLGEFDVQHEVSEDLLGELEVQHIGDEDLLGEFELTHWEDLLGEFHVGQDSEDLLGEFHVGQDSEDLLGEVEIQHTGDEDLLGEFEIAHWENLLGEFVVLNDGSADLLGEFVVQHTGDEDLLGEFVVLNDGSADLLGESVILNSDSVELLGKFRVTVEVLVAEFIVRHSASAELLGEFIVQTKSSAGLHGEFEVLLKDSEELLGESVIQHSDAKVLLGEFIVRNEGSADLLCELIVSGVVDDYIPQGITYAEYLWRVELSVEAD